MIAIITNNNDRHADLICEKMKEKNIKFFRINTENLINQVETTIEFDKNNQEPIVCFDNFKNFCSFDINKAQSVWYRKPKVAKISEEITKQSTRNFIQEEIKAVINGLWFLMKGRYWVSNPWAIKNASNKIYQLNIAKSIGFVIPRTIITTSSVRAKKFYEQYKGNVIAKVLTYGVFEENGHASVILTNKVSPESIKNIKLVRFCPTLFQEYIPKKTEFRITVVGKKVFVCEIYSQESENTRIDWRNYGVKVPYISSKLPFAIQEKCIKLVRKLNLHFGAIDMIRTPNDQFIFLEINPSGQWLWVEEKTGLQISEALIGLLVNQHS